MFLVQYLFSAFLVSAMLISLAPYNIMFLTVFYSTLFMNYLIDTIFFVTWLKVIYSASIINIETVLCFLLYYNNIFLFRKKQYFITNLQFLRSLGKLLSVKLASLYDSGSLGNRLVSCHRWGLVPLFCKDIELLSWLFKGGLAL